MNVKIAGYWALAAASRLHSGGCTLCEQTARLTRVRINPARQQGGGSAAADRPECGSSTPDPREPQRTPPSGPCQLVRLLFQAGPATWPRTVGGARECQNASSRRKLARFRQSSFPKRSTMAMTSGCSARDRQPPAEIGSCRCLVLELCRLAVPPAPSALHRRLPTLLRPPLLRLDAAPSGIRTCPAPAHGVGQRW